MIIFLHDVIFMNPIIVNPPFLEDGVTKMKTLLEFAPSEKGLN